MENVYFSTKAKILDEYWFEGDEGNIFHTLVSFKISQITVLPKNFQ